MSKYPPRNKTYQTASVVVLLLALTAMGIYLIALFNSKETISITVRDKERVCSSADDCDYLIFAEEGVYKNADAVLALKFNSSDLYNKLQPGQTYQVDVWGFRQPLLSMYPNILEVK